MNSTQSLDNFLGSWQKLQASSDGIGSLPDFQTVNLMITQTTYTDIAVLWQAIENADPQGGWCTYPDRHEVVSGAGDLQSMLLAGEWYGENFSLQSRRNHNQWLLVKVLEIESGELHCLADCIQHLRKGDDSCLYYRRYWRDQDGKILPFASRLTRIG